MRQYVLDTKKKQKKLKKRTSNVTRDSVPGTAPLATESSEAMALSVKVRTAEEGLLDFKPDDDEIDELLYERIVERNENVNSTSPYGI